MSNQKSRYLFLIATLEVRLFTQLHTYLYISKATQKIGEKNEYG